MIKNEDELYSYLKKNYVEDLEKNEDEFGVYDCYSKEYDCYYELKSRLTHYDDLMLQQDKFNFLVTKKNNRYICSTPLGVYSINVRKLNNINWIKMLLPSTTSGEPHLKPKVWKMICFIPVKMFKKL